jgi:hypothetical protein
MPVSGAEAVPLTSKNGLPKCNDGLPSVLTWLSKVYSEKQAGALSGSKQEQSLRDDYDDRMRSRFESRSPCTAPRDRGLRRTGLIPMIAAIVRQVQIVSRMGRLT